MDTRTILTVMPDYGMGPFLWSRDAIWPGGVGPNCCDATGRCGDHPMSKGLWEDCRAWVIEFARATSSDPFQVDLPWADFHARGLALARRLKEEVGEEFRVCYLKPREDPGYAQDGSFEILAGGVLKPARWREQFRAEALQRYALEHSSE